MLSDWSAALAVAIGLVCIAVAVAGFPLHEATDGLPPPQNVATTPPK